MTLAATDTFGVAGIAADGSMTWDTAALWINAMNAANYKGFNTWRLPNVTPINGVSFDYSRIDDGTHDRGYNISETGTLYAGSTANELANLYYSTLGNDGRCAPYASTDDATCHDRATEAYYAPWGLLNKGPFTGLQSYRYWTKVENALEDWRAFDLNFSDGQVGTGFKGNSFYAWAVLPGNPTAVPVPAAAWLFGSGLMGLVAVSRRRAF